LNSFVNIQLDTAIKNDLNFYDALVYRGKILLRKKEFEKAFEDFNKAIEADMKNKLKKNINLTTFSPIKHLFNPLISFVFI